MRMGLFESSTPVGKVPLRPTALAALPTSSGAEPPLHPAERAAPITIAPMVRCRFIARLPSSLRGPGFLLHDRELDAPVLLAPLLGLVVADRHVGAVALRGQP